MMKNEACKNLVLKFHAIRPEGWLKNEVQKDVDGCIGHLEELLPDLTKNHDIYGRDRLHPGSTPRTLGTAIEDEYVEGFDDIQNCSYMWWNSETQSNWRDGWCRALLLLGGSEYESKAKQYVDRILNTQDEDGYLGIYSKELRYRHRGENGELWAQSSLFRGLLAYYEATGEARVLHAVIRAMDVTMEGYPMQNSKPFTKEDDHGALHGLTIVDSLHRLHELTGEEKYLDYAVWLYEAYSEADTIEPDMRIENILDPDYIWRGHAAHTYEHLRALIHNGDRLSYQYGNLVQLALTKLVYYLAPSGAGIGDEGIQKRTANATDTGYEFCAVQELFDTYSLLMKKTGAMLWGDKMEWLYYNAAQGMKHPTESSIMYLKTDNCYSVEGKRQPDDEGEFNDQYSYSPTHQKTAVCCVPNMGRITPYFIQSMYRYSPDGIDAILFGPSVFQAQWDGTEITIRQLTDYPNKLETCFEVTVSKPVEFTFGVRKPGWANDVISVPHLAASGSRLTMRKEWAGTERITVRFACDIVAKSDLKKDVSIARGPLLYALPIEAEELVYQELDPKPFRELGYHPVKREGESLRIRLDELGQFKYYGSADDWRGQKIKGIFHEGEKTLERELMPLGGTILRKATFKKVVDRFGN